MRKTSSYFHPRKFIGNNLDYRISSAAGIAKYKEAQSFTLTQIAYNPFHKFSRTAKEIMLLTYDVWFDFLVELEQVFLVETTPEKLHEIIPALAKERINYYRKLLIEAAGNSKHKLDKKYIEEWFFVNKISLEYFFKKINVINDLKEKPSLCFNVIVDVLILLMNHSLYELQELDTFIYGNSKENLIIDKISLERDSNGRLLALKRLEHLFSIKIPKEIILKTYVDLKVMEEKREIFDFLKERNIDFVVI